MLVNSWFPSLPGNLIVWSVIRGTGEEKQWTRSSKRQQTHQCHPPFPGTMTTETTVSKGQEFFSPGQTEGDTGGTLIGSAAVSLLLLTQPRRTSCAIWTGNVLVMKVKRKTVRDTNKRKKEQGVLETNCFHVSLWRRHPALPYTTIPTVYWEAHREQANIATLTGTTSVHFLIFYGSFFI